MENMYMHSSVLGFPQVGNIILSGFFVLEVSFLKYIKGTVGFSCLTRSIYIPGKYICKRKTFLQDSTKSLTSNEMHLSAVF